MKRKEKWSLRHGSHHWQLVGSLEIEKRDGGRTIKSKEKRKEDNDEKEEGNCCLQSMMLHKSPRSLDWIRRSKWTGCDVNAGSWILNFSLFFLFNLRTKL